jgi:DsbC/DsbD-like thiol-disulfide interchange protein
MSRRRCWHLCVTACLGALVVLDTTVSAQDQPIRWSLTAPALQRPLRPGDQVRIQATAEIDEGWHLYSTERIRGGPEPTSLAVGGRQPFELAGVIESPEPRRAHDANFGTEIEFYEKSVTFVVPVRFTASASSGATRLQMEVRFQACNEHICLMPRTSTLNVVLAVRK